MIPGSTSISLGESRNTLPDGEPLTTSDTILDQNESNSHAHESHWSPRMQKVFKLMWLCVGFQKAPNEHVTLLLVAYTISASILLIINRYLGRYSTIRSIDVILLQMLVAVAGVALLRLLNKIALPLIPKHGWPEFLAWGGLALCFAVQLIASIRTLSCHGITEWYLLLHNLTPCIVPFLEPRPKNDESSGRIPMELLVFPSLTLAGACLISYINIGTIGPASWQGLCYSLVWTVARIASLIGTRVAILHYSTPLWSRILYQTGLTALILMCIDVTMPEWTAFVKELGYLNQGSHSLVVGAPTPMPKHELLLPYQVFALMVLACIVGPVTTGTRLALIEEATATSYGIFSSVALFPMRVWYSSLKLLYF
eukprot:m.19455 g.19455  ORF g.19455 m.19455 type:complete len:369 (-) comp12469_c0_seq2:41-1147(-)